MIDDQQPATDDIDVSGCWRASAAGKIILCGEHAVVYGRPAIALPIASVRAHVLIERAARGQGITVHAPDLGRSWALHARPRDTLSRLVPEVLAALDAPPRPDLRISISSDIPIASGMGSGAAIATALVRALAASCARDLSNRQVSELVFANERRLHRTPSGIDNTVIAFERAIWYQRVPVGALPAVDYAPPSIEPLVIAAPLTLLIGDTGVRSATKLPVGMVRKRWQADTASYEALFDAVGSAAHVVRAALAAGNPAALGPLLDQNHALLQQIGVSSPQLDTLVAAARAAGALGAKLSGAGWGGVMLALVTPAARTHVAGALRAAGAARVFAATVASTVPPNSP